MAPVAEKVAEKSAEKSPKQTPKSAAKVFDVSKPNKQPASATSRPVIIPNRPIMQDPMMSTGTTNIKIVEDKPADDKPADAPTTPEVSPSKVKMTVLPLSESAEDKTTTEDKQPDATEEKPAGQPTEDTKTDEAETTVPADKPEEKPADPAKPENDEIPVADPTKDEKLAAELDAAAKRQAELDALTEAKEYFLPINSVERRRSRVVALLGVLLIVALGLLLVDLMLDAGFISIPGIEPLTHIFSV